MRIGYGYDVHRLTEGRKCILCGISIPSSFGPDGHSDADVPVHALIDAMLGALALGDIGTWFPDTDSEWRGANSLELLKTVYTAVNNKGYMLGNMDITIILESPRLNTFIYQMRNKIAETLNTSIDKVSIKATTEEKMGYIGNGSGVAASAAVLLEFKKNE